MKTKWTVMMVIVSTVVAALIGGSVILYFSYAVNANPGNSSCREESFPPDIRGYVIIDGVRYEMDRGGYQWERKCGLTHQVVTTDHASPEQMAETIAAIPVEPNSELEIEIEGEPEINVYQWDGHSNSTTVSLKENERFSVPSISGTYIYEVMATWKNGEYSYVFVIDVEK